MQNYQNQDHYAVLGVARTATGEEIKKAWRIAVVRHHPDKNSTNIEAAQEKLVSINLAYEVLSSPEKRVEFDAYYGQRVEKAKVEKVEAERKAQEKKAQEEEKARLKYQTTFYKFYKYGEGDSKSYEILHSRGIAGLEEETKTYEALAECWARLSDLGLKDLGERRNKIDAFFNDSKGYGYAYKERSRDYNEARRGMAEVCGKGPFEYGFRQGGEAAVNAAIPKLQKFIETYEEKMKRYLNPEPKTKEPDPFADFSPINWVEYTVGDESKSNIERL